MKKSNTITIALFAVLLAVSTAMAGWQEIFTSDFLEKDLNSAVTNALARGISPEEIINTAMAIDGMDSEALVTAMCGAGVPVYTMPNALELLNLNVEKAKNLCEDISATVRFPGSGYSSVSKRTNYDGSGNQPRPPASGHNFN